MFTQLIDLWSEDLAWLWISAAPRQALLILGVALLIKVQPKMAAAWRHWIWLAAALAIGLVPLAAIALPRVPLIPAEWIYGADAAVMSHVVDPHSPVSLGSPHAVEPSNFGAIEWSFLIWCLGAVLLLARLGMGLLGLRSLQRDRMPVVRGRLCARLEHCRRLAGISTLVDLYLSKRSTLPMTWGVVRPAINLPEEAEQWSDERLDAVFLHELGHIQRSDCWTNMVLKIVCALNWFNPFVWMAARRTYLAQEVACDDFACARLRPSNYARHLLELTAVVKDFRRSEIEPAVGLSSCDHLRLRVAAALDPDRSRASLPSRTASLMSGAVFLSMGLMAMVSLRFVDEALAVHPPMLPLQPASEERLDATENARPTASKPVDGGFGLGSFIKGLPSSLEALIMRDVEADESRQESSRGVPIAADVTPAPPRSEAEASAPEADESIAQGEENMLQPKAKTVVAPQVVRAVVVANPLLATQPKLVVPPPVFREEEVNWETFNRRAGQRRGYTIVLNHAQSVCNRYARLSPVDRRRVGGFRSYLRRNGVHLDEAGIRRLIETTRRHPF